MKLRKPITPGYRFRVDLEGGLLSKAHPEKKLLVRKSKIAGRSGGSISVRRRGGGEKRHLRLIDFKRDKKNVPAVVARLEYDPNRTANVALLHYVDGEKRYILAPEGLKPGDKILTAEKTPLRQGNSMPLKNIAPGTLIHNIELIPGKGGQLVRGAGTAATILSKEGSYVQLKMPSGERRMVLGVCMATIGQVCNSEWKNVKLGKAGRSRHFGRRPKVRGVAMFPAAHPHGGGEARAGIGMSSPKSPWGKPTLGKKTRRRKNTRRFIVKDRRSK